MFGSKPMIDTSLIQTSSKDALKRSLMQLYQGDIKTMNEMYDFYMKDMESVPDFDSPQPSTFAQVKDTAVSIFSWADENQDKIMNAVGFVQQLMGKAPITNGVPPTDVPPLP